MSESPEILKLHGEVVTAVAQCVNHSWERIIVHYEMLDTGDSHVENKMALYVYKADTGTHAVESFRLSKIAVSKFNELRDAGEAGKKDKWSTCVLQIDPPGRFKFDFSYEPPKLLKGIIDEEFHYYNKYLPHYLSEKGLSQ